LILLTNDGDIVNEILRSENNHEKEYVVWVDRPITDLSLSMMASGVKIMGEKTKPAKVTRINAEAFRIILTQGLNRQIRRMCSALGYKAQRLQRVRIMNIHLGRLSPGQWRHLTAPELKVFCRAEFSPLARPQRRRGDAFRPLPAAADAPVRILSLVRQPAIEIPALIGPIGIVEQRAAVLDLTVKRLRNPKLARPRVQVIRGEFSDNAY